MANPYEFTDAELAVLAELSYVDIPVKEGQSEPLYNILNDNQAELDAMGPDYSAVVEGLKEKVKDQDYRIVKSVNEKEGSGFSAIAICDPDNNVTVACRGTEGFDVLHSEDSRRDVLTDLELGLEVEADQQRDMEIFMQELQDGDYNSYTFTGHSLGGNLAMHGAITLNDPSKVNKVRTYNAPGFNLAYQNKYSFQISRVENRMHAYQNEYDYVSSVFTTPGSHTIVSSRYSRDGYGFNHHSLSGLRINSDGSFQGNGSGKKGWRTLPVAIVTTGGVNLGWRIRIAFGMLTGSSPFTLAKVRDFTPEMRAMLIAAAAEVEDEAWWRVSRWDCWYRVQNFFGGQNWDLYAGNVDSYYRKLIDINDASVQDIKSIFQKVYSVDETYGAQINQRANRLYAEVNAKLTNIVASINPAAGNVQSGGGRHG